MHRLASFLYAIIIVQVFLVDSAWGASLECHDNETSNDLLDCSFDVSYEEIARAFGNLNCEPSETGLKCHFEPLRRGVPTAVLVTPETAKIDACSSPSTGLCISSKIHTELNQGPRVFDLRESENDGRRSIGSSEETAATGATAATEKPLDKDVDPSSSETPSTTTTTTTTTTQETEPHEFGIIRVGNRYYRQPYDQYAAPVADVLHARAHLWKKTPPTRDSVSHEYSMGNAYFDIGIAHYATVTEEDDYPGTYSHLSADAFDLKFAVNAFQQAEIVYKQVLEKHTQERHVVHASLASLYLQWGEVYQSSHYYPDDDNDDNNNVNEKAVDDGGDGLESSLNDKSLSYFEKAETHYRLSIETGKNVLTDHVLKATQINLARTCHRVGRCLVNSLHDGGGGGGGGDGGGFFVRDNSVTNVLPQIQKLVTVIPKAQKKFGEAIRLFRTAIDEERQFDALIGLKRDLCTTLQDAGAAASYASNYAKAIELQEDGVAVCKEILPHVPVEDVHYMTQYIADSMYGISNHYMQLGKYDETTASYQRTMDWYEEHDLEPAVVVDTGFFETTDESIEAYEQQLADYQDMKTEVSIPDGYEYEGGLRYEPNDAYEADLYAALGSLHLSKNEVLMAIENLNQAIQLYENFDGEENLDRTIADCKTSLAAAYFQNSEFRQSAEVHKEAMDLYREVVGEGKNPLLDGLVDKLEAVGEFSDTYGLGDVLGSELIQDLLSALGVEGLTATLEKITKKDEKEGTTTDSSSGTGESTERGKGEQKKVHEELIDIEKIRQAFLNVTSMKAEL